VGNQTPTDSRIWTSISKNKDTPRNIQAFIWKCMHGAHKCGPYWTNIPQYEHCAQCSACDVPESMEHILFQCPANKGETVWNQAKEMFKLKEIRWPDNFWLGHILTSGLTKIKDQNGKRRVGASRLYAIIIMESAWLIWKLRNERVLDHAKGDPKKQFTSAEVTNHIIDALNTRLTID
jgi:hypothetical protein